MGLSYVGIDTKFNVHDEEKSVALNALYLESN